MWTWLLVGVSPCGRGCLWVCPHVDVAACGCVPMWTWLLVGVSHVDVAASGCVCVGVTVRVCMQESAARVGEYEHVSQCCIVVIRAIMFTCPSLISMPHRLLRTYVEANRYTHTCAHTRHTHAHTQDTHTCAHRHTHTCTHTRHTHMRTQTHTHEHTGIHTHAHTQDTHTCAHRHTHT